MNKSSLFKKASLTTVSLILLSVLFKLFTAAVFLCAGWILFTTVAVCSLRSGIFGPALTRKPESKAVYLTFDDGPDPELTPKVLDLLKEKGISASFFLIAEKARNYPELVRRMIDEGHTVGSHDLDHRWWANFRRTDALRRDISLSVEILESITGRKITLYRPPVGLTNPHTHRVCRELNLTITGWNRSARDGGNRRQQAISRLAALPVKPGDIVMMHDTAPSMYTRNMLISSLESLISRIKKERYTTEPL